MGWKWLSMALLRKFRRANDVYKVDIHTRDYIASGDVVYELIGYIAEWRHWSNGLNRYTSWTLHWNNKIYASLDIAKQAMKGNITMFDKTEIRYRAIYAPMITSN